MSKSAQSSGLSEEVALEVSDARELIGQVVVSPADDSDATHSFVDRKVWRGPQSTAHRGPAGERQQLVVACC